MDADFDIIGKLDEILGRPGRMLPFSRMSEPRNRTVKNANVIIEYGGKFRKRLDKVWFGDLSLAESEEALQALATEADVTIHVLYEMDARFDTEKNPRIEEAVATFKPEEGR